MGERADSGVVRRIARVAAVQILVIAPLVLLGGCLPQSQSDDDSAAMSFAGSGPGGGSSGKSDALIRDISAGADRALGSGGKSASESLRQQHAIVTTTNTSFTGGEGPPGATPPAPALVEIRDTPAATALGDFFRALSAIESGADPAKPVTILHLGDSHIAADRFSGDMREQFQSRFGNAGRGLLMPGVYMSRGVKFDQGGRWQVLHSTGGGDEHYGVTGVKITGASREEWLRLTTADQPFAWTEITFQSAPGQGSALVSLDGESKLAPPGAGHGANTIRLEKPARELVIRPKGDGPITIHGIAIGQAKPGVRYINLGLPGATAQTPLSWRGEQVADDLRRLAPNLIILGYGTAEALDDSLDLRSYEAKLNALLPQLRQMAPQASLLVIGPPDIARLPQFAAGTARASDVCRALSPQERASYAQRLAVGDVRLARWHPPLRLEEVRIALRRAAAANQAYFWDWSKLMGGTCGIHAWVHSDPPLAAADHVHLTEEGSRRSARLLFRELMAGYDDYDRAVSPVESVAAKPAPPTAGWKAVRQPVGGMGGR